MTGASEPIAQQTQAAFRVLATLPASLRTEALKKLHALLLQYKDDILTENQKDVTSARNAKLPDSLISRLDLAKKGKYEDMAQGVLDVATLTDLVGKCTQKRQLDDNLILRKVACPIGVLLVIFEARPEVIVNITALALKSGNAAILKGGKESTHTFRALAALVKQALSEVSIPSDTIALIESREDVNSLLAQDQYIDLIIPRGSNALVRTIKENTKIPVMGHADGLCHLYMHEDADQHAAIPVILDSKTNYVAACNALESLLIHESLVSTFLPKITAALNAAGVLCKVEKSLLADLPSSDLVQAATTEDFETEHLSMTISIRAVASLDSAVDWINKHGSHHTDVILTTSSDIATQFQRAVDSACVFTNCSTRFADGMRFGLGTEVGIATGKIHARGPVGLEGLMTYKWLLDGSGQGVADYSADGTRKFTHQEEQPTAEDNY